MLPQLRGIADRTTREVFIVSPYFVPGPSGMAFFRSLRERGIRVVVLSNSLAANNLAAVHVGYRRYRKPLLRAGWNCGKSNQMRNSRDGPGRPGHPPARKQNRPAHPPTPKSFVFDRANAVRRFPEPRSALGSAQYGNGPGH